MFFKRAGFILACTLLGGCAFQGGTPGAATAYATQTPDPTALSVPSPTPSPGPAAPTLTSSALPLIEGSTSTQVNVRAEPSTTGEVVGVIPANAVVQIIGKDPGGNWWQIVYPSAAGGNGWVTTQFVTTARGEEVPTLGGTRDGILAVIRQKLNVRSGPGIDFNPVGTLNPQDSVNLLGKDRNATWLQIEFAAGPQGKGWISAAFVEANELESLPIVSDTGLVLGTGTPKAPPIPPTPTLVPAWPDNDSADRPGAHVVFEPNGTRSLILSGDLSSPRGDPEDWIRITPYTGLMEVGLECSTDALLEAKIEQLGQIPGQTIECNQARKAIRVDPGTDYVIHLRALQSGQELHYIRYTLTIEMSN